MLITCLLNNNIINDIIIHSVGVKQYNSMQNVVAFLCRCNSSDHTVLLAAPLTQQYTVCSYTSYYNMSVVRNE